MRPLVLYHANCWDGFCAAWVARKALGDIEAVPVQYGQEPPDVAGREVYILDFSYKRPAMIGVMKSAHSVVVLDHHKTAQAELADIVHEFIETCAPITHTTVPPLIVFDMDKSGGRLAWEYFAHPQSSLANIPIPWLVNYTEDRDLWRHALPESREVNAYIRSWPLDFTRWDVLATYDRKQHPDAWINMVNSGGSILRREKQIIDDHLRHARDIELDGHTIPAVNATVLFSDIAGELAKGRPFGACYFDRADGKRQWSLRSEPEGVDVSEVAKRNGGGGHKHAAGFEVAVQ